MGLLQTQPDFLRFNPELNTGGTAGLEYQPRFSSDKNLKLRNREDNPISNLPGDSITSATYNPTPTSGNLTPQQACEALGSYYAWDPTADLETTHKECLQAG